MAQHSRAPKRPHEGDGEAQGMPGDTLRTQNASVSHIFDVLGPQAGEQAEHTGTVATAEISSDGLGWPGVLPLTSKVDTQQDKFNT